MLVRAVALWRLAGRLRLVGLPTGSGCGCWGRRGRRRRRWSGCRRGRRCRRRRRCRLRRERSRWHPTWVWRWLGDHHHDSHYSNNNDGNQRLRHCFSAPGDMKWRSTDNIWIRWIRPDRARAVSGCANLPQIRHPDSEAGNVNAVVSSTAGAGVPPRGAGRTRRRSSPAWTDGNRRAVCPAPLRSRSPTGLTGPDSGPRSS